MTKKKIPFLQLTATASIFRMVRVQLYFPYPVYLQEEQSTKITTLRITMWSPNIVLTDPENTYIH